MSNAEIFTQMKWPSLIAIVLSLLCCSCQSEFQQRYDHYFPKNSAYADGMYRDYYDHWLFGAPPPKADSGHLWQLYDAFHGDASATHLFFHNADRDADGETSEAWFYDCVLLLLRLGDERFSDFFAREDQTTKQKVGAALDAQIDFGKDPFPKTRSLYQSHWRPHTRLHA